MTLLSRKKLKGMLPLFFVVRLAPDKSQMLGEDWINLWS